jgi:hypothetical protein
VEQDLEKKLEVKLKSKFQELEKKLLSPWLKQYNLLDNHTSSRLERVERKLMEQAEEELYVLLEFGVVAVKLMVVRRKNMIDDEEEGGPRVEDQMPPPLETPTAKVRHAKKLVAQGITV